MVKPKRSETVCVLLLCSKKPRHWKRRLRPSRGGVRSKKNVTWHRCVAEPAYIIAYDDRFGRRFPPNPCIEGSLPVEPMEQLATRWPPMSPKISPLSFELLPKGRHVHVPWNGTGWDKTIPKFVINRISCPIPFYFSILDPAKYRSVLLSTHSIP